MVLYAMLIVECVLQEQLRKRKEDEERQAAQTEFLNRSLRGSRKLQALQEAQPLSQPPQALPQPDKRSGVVNDGFSSADEDLEPELLVDEPAVSLHRVVGRCLAAAAVLYCTVQSIIF